MSEFEQWAIGFAEALFIGWAIAVVLAFVVSGVIIYLVFCRKPKQAPGAAKKQPPPTS